MKNLILCMSIVLLVIGCKPKTKVVDRDERNMAFDAALDFTEAALLQHNYQKAYLHVSKNNGMTFEEFGSSIDRIHSKGFPVSIAAGEYEPVPGQEKINIFLYGRNGDESFYYLVVMDGTKKTSYRVFSLQRSDGPYPPNELRQRLRTILPVMRYKHD
jgi:hypothetical protein